jgi:hypothetical protein
MNGELTGNHTGTTEYQSKVSILSLQIGVGHEFNNIT